MGLIFEDIVEAGTVFLEVVHLPKDIVDYIKRRYNFHILKGTKFLSPRKPWSGLYNSFSELY